MMTCETCRDQLLDHAYGLLDEADVWPVEAHLRTCDACRAERDRAVGLIASASKSPHPTVAFTPPAPKSAPATPSTVEPGVVTVREVWLRWAVAASLLLAVAALGGPGARDLIATAWFRPAVTDAYARYTAADREQARLGAEIAAGHKRLADAVAAAKARHDGVAQAWMEAEALAVRARVDSPFSLDVTGPAVAVAGAPNEYQLKASGRDLTAVKFVATVAGPDGKPVYTQAAEGREATVTLPADLWSRLPAGVTPTLTVSATDVNRAEAATVTETVKLADPQLTTMLVTDRPLYRPGDRVYYRSLTLDRTTFRPAGREQNLKFRVEGPDNRVVPGSDVVGLATPVRDGKPVPGPDGSPVRGVGTGAFDLPRELPGGEYTLKVFEVGLIDASIQKDTPLLASRKFLVNRYTPDRLLKTLELDGRTYGPGDAVQAKLTVRDQGQPAPAGVKATVTAKFPGKKDEPLPLDLAPTATDAGGDAVFKFTLPKGDVADVSLSVTVSRNGVVETITKPVPLVSRKLVVEFFPEGGDLVVGVPNRVYVRATTPAGKPADLTGTLSDGTPVKTLTDPDRPGVNQGLGVFTVTPVAGRDLFLTLTAPAGIDPPHAKGFPLPVAKLAGVVSSVPDGVTKPGDPLRVTLTAVGPARRSVVVGAYTRGRAMAHARATLEPGKPTDVTLDFAGAKLGGVTRVTVSDALPEGADLTPVAERLVFRRPGEVLTITAATRQAGGAAFLPGAPVELTVTTADETGAATPAVLWAAVVNQSVLTMADDRTARLLPTHFLLAGEVQKPDELEQADFLLTDHPKAAAALDLVLGTQGWRRFAEQSAGRVNRQAQSGSGGGGEDRDRLLASMGAGRRGVAGWSATSARLAEAYLPRYQAAAADLTKAEDAQRDGSAALAADPAYAEAGREAYASLSQLRADGGELAYYQKAIAERRDRLPLTVALLCGLALLLGLALVLRPADWGVGERRWLRRAVVGFAVLGAFSVVVVLLTYRSDDGWLRTVQSNALSHLGGRIGPLGVNGEPDEKLEPPIPPRRDYSPQPRPPMPPARPELVFDNVLGGPAFGPPGLVSPQGVPIGKITEARKVVGLRRSFDRVRIEGDVPVDPETRKQVRAALPPEPTLVVREYAHARRADPAADPLAPAAETLLWQPVVVTPADGQATLTFDLPDAVAGYQVLVAGHTLDGRLGASVTTIEARKPFAVDVKLPPEIGSADRLTLPVTFANATDRDVSPGLSVTAQGLTIDPLPADRPVPAGGGSRVLVGVRPNVAEGAAEFTLRGVDSARRGTTVVPDGFPVQGGASGVLAKSVALPLTLPQGWTPGTLRASVVVYPNAVAEVQGGLDGLLREPMGCFEQASSANYPNVLVLSLLRETNQTRFEASAHAKGLLDRGYARLVGFECPRTAGGGRVGFEWFGTADRPHDALTAYALVQFADMARVYPVDAKLVARTKQFLLDARDGTGGYRPPPAGSHAFGRAPAATVAAYVTWAITQAEAKVGDKPSDLAKELDALFARATNPEGAEAKDPFFLALTASSLLARNRTADGVKLLQAAAKLQQPTGELGGVPTSITQSSGKSLAIEATAAACLAWFQAERPDLFAVPLQKAMAWLNGQRDPSGAFGSTQSTVLALKAITEQARRNKRPAESGELVVRVAGVVVARRAFTAADAGPITIPVPEAALTAGVTVEATAGAGYPVSLTWHARTATPETSPDCPLTLTTALDRAEYAEGDPARVSVTLANPGAKPVGMVMAVVGLPAGLRLPPDLKQLKALTDRPAAGEPRVSYFEVKGREVVLYRHGLAAGETVTLSIDAVAETPGTTRGPASRAYAYYNAEHKHWAKPLAATVTAK